MYPTLKRILDFLAAATALCLLLPLFLPIMLVLRFSAEGAVFYKQLRIGLNSQPFWIWKFATMLKNSPNMGSGTITLRHDPRVTPIGRFLRRSKINELPQLLNVLKGEMSFVGPRPLDEKGYLAYPEAIRDQIFRVKPGITGLGSIVFRDEEQFISAAKLTPETFYRLHIAPYKGALEMWYQKHNGFLIDFILICLTIWAILSPNNQAIYQVFPTLPKLPDEFKTLR